MSDIAPIGRSSVQPVSRAARFYEATVQTTANARGRDRADFSNAAQLLSKIASLPDIREDLVARVKGEIANGTYETPEKVEQALAGLAEDLVD